MSSRCCGFLYNQSTKTRFLYHLHTQTCYTPHKNPFPTTKKYASSQETEDHRFHRWPDPSCRTPASCWWIQTIPRQATQFRWSQSWWYPTKHPFPLYVCKISRSPRREMLCLRRLHRTTRWNRRHRVQRIQERLWPLELSPSTPVQAIPLLCQTTIKKDKLIKSFFFFKSNILPKLVCFINKFRPIRMQLLSFLCMCLCCVDEVAECCRMLPNAAEIDNMMTKKPHTNQADFAVGGNG